MVFISAVFAPAFTDIDLGGAFADQFIQHGLLPLACPQYPAQALDVFANTAAA